MRRKLVLGNWKMNGTRVSAQAWANAARRLAQELTAVEIGVLPSFVHLSDVTSLASGSALRVGAQDLAAQTPGAFTGAIAAEMLVDAGATHVLIGHSERRHVFGESNALVAEKLIRALGAGLVPVLCVGESLEQREAGQTADVVLEQLQALLLIPGADALQQTIIAYEPVWAIGTGKTATPMQAQEVHALIRSAIGKRDAMLSGLIRILYGGSVKGSNAAQLFALPDIDGGLIGGASLVPDDFAEICRAASLHAIEKIDT